MLIFKERELKVLPGPTSAFVKGALKMTTIQCLFFRPEDPRLLPFPLFFKSKNLKRLSVVHYVQLILMRATSLKDR